MAEAEAPASAEAARSVHDQSGEDVVEIDDLSAFLIDDEQGEAAPLVPPKKPSAGGVPLPSGVRKGTTEDVDPTGFPDSYDRDLDLDFRSDAAKVNLDGDNGDEDEYDPGAEDEEAAEFTFTRGGAETVEELDLAAMVDVAFQLVLFFLVTASTVVFKTLEVPRPNPEEKEKGTSVQSSNSTKTIDDMAKDNILVDISPTGEVKVNRENAPNDFNGLVARLKKIKTDTGMTGMLLTADPTTAHKHSVLAYDAANELALRITLAQVKSKAADKSAVPPGAAEGEVSEDRSAPPADGADRIVFS